MHQDLTRQDPPLPRWPALGTATLTEPPASEALRGEEWQNTALPARDRFVGRYLLLELVGRGGMGEVYVAYDPELDRKVALKLVRSDQGGATAQARLVAEAQAAARLTHPNVVRIYDVGAVGHRVFLAMELIEGTDVAVWGRAAPRAWREVLRLFCEAGRGLAAAHAAGLVHRDFKASNVLVATDGRVLVADFGVALDLGQEGKTGLARRRPSSPPVAGTWAYMAPEQMRGGVVDHRADQFSFCAALWEALYGEPPYAGDSVAARLLAIASGSPSAPRERRVPLWLRRVVERGLALDATNRFPSLEALLAALSRRAATVRRRWQAAALLVAAGLAAVLWWRLPPPAAELCTGGERKLAGVWDAGRKVAVRAALGRSAVASGVGPGGEVIWTRIEPLLDAYAEAWARQHDDSCAATRLRGEQSSELLDLRMACLEERRQELRTASDLLAGEDPATARNALSIARGLSSLAGCADARSLLTPAAPPAEAAVRARIAVVRALIAESKVLEKAGRFGQAHALAERAAAEAEEIAYAPLTAEAQLALATTAGRTAHAGAMREALLAALDFAQASRHDEVVARALTMLSLAALLNGNPNEAELWLRLAGSAIERLGEGGEIAAQRQYFAGLVAQQEGRAEAAVEHFVRYLTLVDGGSTASQAALHGAYLNLGIAAAELGRSAAARTYLESSLREGREVYGLAHPGVAATLTALGSLELREGRLAAAEARYRQGLSIFEGVGTPSPGLAEAQTGLGRALLAQGRASEAVPVLEAAVRLQAERPLDPLDLARSRFTLARALALTSPQAVPGRARRLALAAREALAGLGERGRPELARVAAWLAAQGGR